MVIVLKLHHFTKVISLQIPQKIQQNQLFGIYLTELSKILRMIVRNQMQKKGEKMNYMAQLAKQFGKTHQIWSWNNTSLYIILKEASNLQLCYLNQLLWIPSWIGFMFPTFILVLFSCLKNWNPKVKKIYEIDFTKNSEMYLSFSLYRGLASQTPI